MIYYLRIVNHQKLVLSSIEDRTVPVPRIGETVTVHGDDIEHVVKKVNYVVGEDLVGVVVTVHSPDIVTCEFCKTSTSDLEVKYPRKYGGQIKCLRPSEDPAYEFCGGRLFYANGKQCDRPINPTK